MADPWTRSDPRWLALDPYQRAAAMALMEADGADPQSARNALGSMINRAAKEGVDLGEHVSKPIYQPAIEPNQRARLDRLMRSEAYPQLTSWAERRSRGLEPDPVQGATHFLAPEKTMLSLEQSNPGKYKNWGPRGANWTGYDPETGSYKGVVMRDGSHAFLAPEGAHSVPFKADNAASPAMMTDFGRVRPDVPSTVASAPAASDPFPKAKEGFAAFAADPIKGVGDGLGAFAAAMKGTNGQSDQNALAARQAQEALNQTLQQSQSALNQDEQRQQMALQAMIARRKNSAFG